MWEEEVRPPDGGPLGTHISDLRVAEKMNEVLELSEAVDQLSNNHLGVNMRFKNGQERKSFNFLRHPKFEKYFSILEKYWGNESLEMNKKRIFELIKICRDYSKNCIENFAHIQQMSLEEQSNYFRDICLSADEEWNYIRAYNGLPDIDFIQERFEFSKDALKEADFHRYPQEWIPDFLQSLCLLHEIFWVRDGKNNILSLGYDHDDFYHHYHRYFYESLSSYIDFAVLEGFTDHNFGSMPVQEMDSINSGFDFAQMVRDMKRENPSIVFARMNPRNALTRCFDIYATEYPNSFYEYYFSYLKRIRSKWASNIVQTGKNLRKIMGVYSLNNLAAYKTHDKNGILSVNTHYSQDSECNFYSTSVPLGLENGETNFYNATVAHKLLRLSRVLSQGENKKWKKFRDNGAIILNVDGFNHTSEIREYLFDPLARIKIMGMHPHYFATQSEVEDNDYFTSQKSSCDSNIFDFVTPKSHYWEERFSLSIEEIFDFVRNHAEIRAIFLIEGKEGKTECIV